MDGEREVRGTIFNIQHYSVHDGPGIRSTVFLKGCPLRCVWCHNPESQSPRPELMFFADRCTGCASCAVLCPVGAVTLFDAGLVVTDRTKCTGCGRCVEGCTRDARSISGYEVSAGRVFDKVAADLPFYRRSSGGVTISGGEPLMQPAFAGAILSLCREANIHTAVETCGSAPWETARLVLSKADLILFDIKQMDDELHRAYTGVSNSRILENATRIRQELNADIWVRVPVIPGYNDSIENIRETARFVASELGREVRMELLPYHNLGGVKSQRLNRACATEGLAPPSADYMEALRRTAESVGLTVGIQ